MYQHLVDSYSVKLREEWNVKVEEMNVEVVQQVKEEPQDDNLVDSQQLQLSNRINQLEVVISQIENCLQCSTQASVAHIQCCILIVLYGIDDVIVVI